ncbi:MAG: ATP-dependent DNA helicase [Agathobacter sp.]|nr:ATP-dependent DNA helicase [Agathobacter sp.]MBQ2283999.1 ATP-dependent DNA helicase [Agathobacter sp.]
MSAETTDNIQKLHISVRNLVEFIFREGDIDNRGSRLQNADAMMEGTRIHKKIQSAMGVAYQAEVPLKITEEEELYELTIDGRADGIFTEDGVTWIDEIKGVYRSLERLEEPVFVHKAQAMCYAYIFAWQNDLSEIGVQMTYCNLETEERKYFRQMFTFSEIESWYLELIEKYKKWADFQCRWRKIRQESIKQLEFPFPYRDGQKQLAGDVYRTIARKKTLFLQAPTGVGKTISTIFPAVKAVGEDLADRIFYLTAKTITASVARETFGLLREKGYRGKVIQITAKEKLCMCEEMDCNPVNCPYAKGHFDRVNDAVFELLQKSDLFTREEILAQAEKHMVCPFEMSLDVASWSDDIICDYNYAFDPTVYLKRFFQDGIQGDYILLVDEAHNLVERSRSMYSAEVYKEDFLEMKRIMKNYSKGITKLLDKCNKQLLEMKRECENYMVLDHVGNFYFSLMRLVGVLEDLFAKGSEIPERKKVLDFYFQIRNFMNIYELVDEHYVIYSQLNDDGRFMLKLYCVDPSLNLQNCLDRVNSTIFFSATLLPIQYYKSLLSTKTDNYAIYAKSTFTQDQQMILMAEDVSTKYTRRNEAEFERIAFYIYKMVLGKKGNYMAFFPSYRLMEQVYDKFLQIEDFGCETLLQKAGMKEQEREEFLQAFEEERENSFVAFCVMGGIFGEGIDLKNDRLIGAAIVGTGLPQISNEQEILKDYYDGHGGCGFDYAFRYPGMNKVLQAAGRVIRTTEDRGIILLLDERFLTRDYERLYPREWEQRTVCSGGQVEDLIRDFWNKGKIDEQKSN